MEPGTDRPPAAARLPRGRGDAHQPRGHRPGAVRARPGGAAPRADRLPAHRPGVADAPGAHPRTGQVLRRPRDHDQPTPGGGGRSGGAGPLGGRSHPGLGRLGDRHPGGAHDALHDAAPSAPHGRPRPWAACEERPRARRAWRRGGARRHHARDHDRAGAAATVADLGPGGGDGAARPPAGRHRPWRLLLRPAQPVAARHEREHQRALAQYFPKGTDLGMHTADDLSAVAGVLNARPRQTLGWRTPAEALDQVLRSAHTDPVATTA
jgi:hypothetical protein